jgi:Protein of unknown function (DUF3617)
MSKPCVFAAAFLVLSITTALAAAPVRRAGEWETTFGTDNTAPPRVVCYGKDEVLDQNNMTRAMSRIPGANCTIDQLNTVGNVTTFSSKCTVQGNTITSSGTITVTGQDAFATKIHSSGGTFKMPNGQSMTMPESDMVIASHRLGPCKPGERQVNE